MQLLLFGQIFHHVTVWRFNFSLNYFSCDSLMQTKLWISVWVSSVYFGLCSWYQANTGVPSLVSFCVSTFLFNIGRVKLFLNVHEKKSLKLWTQWWWNYCDVVKDLTCSWYQYRSVLTSVPEPRARDKDHRCRNKLQVSVGGVRTPHCSFVLTRSSEHVQTSIHFVFLEGGGLNPGVHSELL